MNLRRYIDIIVEAQAVNTFDERKFFQHLSTLVQEIRQSLKQATKNTSYRDELKPLIKEMIGLVRTGKIRAKDYSKYEYQAFIQRIENLVSQSGIDPEDLPNDIEKTDNISGEKQIVLKKQQQDQAVKKSQTVDNSNEKWQVIRLAVRPGHNSKSDPVGIAKQGTEYYLFKGAVDGKYVVTSSPDLSSAQKQFINDLNAGGYTEVSPGSYNAVRNGTNIASVAKAQQYDHYNHAPLKHQDDIPPNAKVWR